MGLPDLAQAMEDASEKRINGPSYMGYMQSKRRSSAKRDQPWCREALEELLARVSVRL